MQPPVPVRPQLVPGVVEEGAVVCCRLLDDEHVAGHGVQGQPQLAGQQRLLGEATEDDELGPGQEVLGQEAVVTEYDQVVAEDEGCRVGEDSEHLGHHLAAPPSQDALRQREVEQERLHAGHLEVGERVGVQVVGEAVADLILQSQTQEARSNIPFGQFSNL